jgi:chromosome segregation ATPase
LYVQRNKYEQLQQEVKHLKQTTGLAVAALECRVAQLQDQLDSSLRQQAQLYQEMKQLKEHFEVRKADLSQNTFIHF